MRRKTPALIICYLLMFFACETYGQQTLVSDSGKKQLANFSALLNDSYVKGHQQALALAKSHGWFIRKKTKNGGIIALEGVNSLGFPMYLTTHNLTSAQTTNTTVVWPGGASNLNLSGSSAFLDGKLAIWDGGSVYTGHQEFAGKTITIKDDTAQVLDHSTHVAGTMIAKGVYLQAKGMAFNANTLTSYDFDNDVAKMSKAAPDLLLSNHSYGDEAGWDQNDDGSWTWYGLPGDTVDYSFGIYDARTQAFDQIAYNAPYYLIVESAGNSHDYPGPTVGADYFGYKSRTDQTIVDKGPRPANISNNSGYKVISTTGNAKNILTVTAVNEQPNGPVNSQDIAVASFSSYGPTDDGRIKPDIAGMGLEVVSTAAGGPQSYLTESGTSMAAPNVTGSLYLLQEYYAQQNGGKFMRAATLKGLACGTAFDAGNPGPDYIYGWGLLNMAKAAQAITNNGTKSMVTETFLQQSQKQTFSVVASGSEPLITTISWTDPAAPATPDGTPDATIKLVNDLDVRVSDGVTIFKPWVLDPTHPAAPATTGDNIRDNIEQVYIANAVAGKTYTVTVSNKGNLQSGVQDYSLILTGAQSINASAKNTGSDIDLAIYPVPASNLLNIAFNNNANNTFSLALINSAGRTVYANNRNLEPGSFDISLDVSAQTPGAYVVKMLLGGKFYARKVIIVR
jgi:hypothetical protein